ncbi:hypothetical protein OH77DRAFT_1253675 [Trametes cingulata]|nr:hypothetical protein OH77DRAFT_1253675 [Trametes cingulata]
MERCPVEISDLIFADACTDDGYTGRSLSLVSKRVRAISSRHALQSIALYGPHQIFAFGTFLEGRKDEDRCVRHLYLTDRPRLWHGMKLALDKDDLGRPVVIRLRDNPSGNSFTLILRILRIVAQHLRTLSLLLFGRSHHDYNPLTMISFPRLEELTLHVDSLSSESHSPLQSIRTLRRLHIIQRYSLPQAIAEIIADLAPHLTHLRLSRMTGSPSGAVSLLQGVERMLEDHDGSGVPDPAQPCFLSSLQRVIVELSPRELDDSRQPLQVGTPIFTGSTRWRTYICPCLTAVHSPSGPPATRHRAPRCPRTYRDGPPSPIPRHELRHRRQGNSWTLHVHQGELAEPHPLRGGRVEGRPCRHSRHARLGRTDQVHREGTPTQGVSTLNSPIRQLAARLTPHAATTDVSAVTPRTCTSTALSHLVRTANAPFPLPRPPVFSLVPDPFWIPLPLRLVGGLNAVLRVLVCVTITGPGGVRGPAPREHRLRRGPATRVRHAGPPTSNRINTPFRGHPPIRCRGPARRCTGAPRCVASDEAWARP